MEATSVQSSALNPRLRFAAWLGGAVAVAAVALGAMFWFRADPARPQRTNVDYLAARALIRKSGSTQIRTAIDLLEKVVQRDPGFAPAWASLAEGYTLAADFPPALALPLSPVELQKHVATAALHAFELAPDAPETLRSAGMISMQNHDWSEAEQRLQRALQLAGPGDYEANLEYAWFLMNVGRVREATPYEERAMRIEPSLMRPVALRAALYEMNGDLNAAESLLLANGNLQENDPLRRQGLFMVRMARHDQCGVPGKPAADGLPCPLLADPQGALSQARTSYENAVASGNAGQLFALAHFAAFLGDRKLALDMLDLWSNGSTQNLHIVWRPVMREVREMPGFVELVRKVGLVDYWRTTGHWGDFCRPVGASSVSCSTPQFATNEPKTTERASPPGFTLARGFPAM
ncbi:MAG: tetratricopeptide repeat protein [Pseudomonadota bacterium]